MDFGLQDIIKLSVDTPALDPILIDCTNIDKKELIQKVYGVTQCFNFRMLNMGIMKFRRCLVAEKSIADYIDVELNLSVLKLDKVYHASKYAYIITHKVDGREIVHPPFYNNQPGYMSWGEYFLRIAGNRNPGNLVIIMPFLQARFDGISI